MRDEITQQTMQAIGAKAAPIVTYTGGATADFFGLSANEFAALCGVLGLKPTYGRNSRYGSIPYGSSLDQIAPMAKNVEDLVSLMEVMAGSDILDGTTVEYPISNI